MIYNLNLRLYTKEALFYPVDGNTGEQANHLFVTAKSPKGQTDFWCSDPEASKDIYNILIKRIADFIKDHESEIHEDFKFGAEEPVKEKNETAMPRSRTYWETCETWNLQLLGF